MTNQKALVTLLEVIGDDLMEKVIQALGGSNIYIPSDIQSIYRERRNQKIRDAYRSGVDVPVIQAEYPLTSRQILRIANDEWAYRPAVMVWAVYFLKS